MAGCTIYSPGCKNCYAMKLAARLEAMGQARYAGLTHKVNGNVVWTGAVRPVPAALDQPLRWKKPRLIFVNSMSDLFHEGFSNEQIAAVFGVICQSLHDRPRENRHTYQILTKRAERLPEWFAWARKEHAGWFNSAGLLDLGNVWVGVSVERQQEADQRIPHLLKVPVKVRFLSCEPLLAPVNLHEYLLGFTAGNPSICVCGHGHGFDRCPNYGRVAKTCHIRGCECAEFRKRTGGDGLHWVIVGGESGPGARPMQQAWAESIIRQCQGAGVPVFVKQMGSVWARSVCVNGRSVAAHGDPKGGDPQWWPEGLRVREMPR